MPHKRCREIENLLIKRIKLWPVLGVVGVRQCGKSTLLRDLFLARHSGIYQTMDSKTQRARAQQVPESFTALDKNKDLLIIDEVQKVPDLFDAIKLHVDQNRRPGMYIISGSTEFSKLTGIRESLTGRIGVLRLYPMTLSELHSRSYGNYFINKNKPLPSALNLKEFDRKLFRGGMPGLCFLRNDDEFATACDVWLETTCYRDLLQVHSKSLNGDLAMEILMVIAKNPEPTLAEIARKLRRDARQIKPYLEALAAILVVHKLEPHEAGVGKTQYALCDSGLASHLGAEREAQLRIHLLTEALAKFEYAGFGRPLIKTYRNEKTSRVPLVLEWVTHKSIESVAIAYYDGEAVPSHEYERLWAFAKRASPKKHRLLLLTHTRESYVEKSKHHTQPIEVFCLRA
jgi:predicted AAA+ superfamily ATPase